MNEDTLAHRNKEQAQDSIDTLGEMAFEQIKRLTNKIKELESNIANIKNVDDFSPEYHHAKKVVRQWDMDTLVDYSVGNLANFYKDNPEDFQRELIEWLL